MKISTQLINKIIDELETLMVATDKEFLKTETIRKRLEPYLPEAKEGMGQEFQANGITQAIQQCLQNRDYRCIRPGVFVNLSRCEDIEILQELESRAELSVESKERVRERIREIKNQTLSGQLYFNLDMEIIVPINEEQLRKRIEAEAV